MTSSLDTLALSGTELSQAQLEQADGGMLCLLLALIAFTALNVIDMAIRHS
jgi:hypothetical protein